MHRSCQIVILEQWRPTSPIRASYFITKYVFRYIRDFCMILVKHQRNANIHYPQTINAFVTDDYLVQIHSQVQNCVMIMLNLTCEWWYDDYTPYVWNVVKFVGAVLHDRYLIVIEYTRYRVAQNISFSPKNNWNIIPLKNYTNPVYGVDTICHQVRCLRWEHPSLFHTATSLLIWYKIFCMRDMSYRLLWIL